MKGFLIACLLLVASMANAQISKLDKLFEQYQGKKGVTTLKIGAPMFKLLGNLKIDDEDMQTITPLLKNVKSLRMLIVEDGEDKALTGIIQGAVSNLKYEELMSLNNEGQDIRFMVENMSANADILNNLLLTINGDGQNLFMILDGAIPLKDVTSLVNEGNNKVSKNKGDNNKK
ncbi:MULTISPECIES: DUF4252 domain-containing protein [Sphingobacterium]|jgi:hypothetical protein|uniref:DUF4252 domain-containing protein n=3 Tax=Sphingobacterium TaxID=28453 RepID=A0ACD5BVJ1_9SPHI|nr:MULTISPECIES: DUF4252 domain-containing protein [Sphingobacterium]HAE68082.1 DUF4252 domain-containing protein [Sphingobacterium sp.]KKO90303.1 hypothetical protein AAW12_17490 [Sphingobacterium sp. Ag1]OJZ03439.1 MAG: hypothetical protein BGP15_20515 [Sphingobacterium sp. 40-24]QQT43978.1 DUF4252 domain-containing protein [Sphingobacterium multivorum]QQT63270.1 DUF4252 domain-containing protein [Sphingobacterium multivorum]